MAVFKQELNWSSFQDKQLKFLESISNSFERSSKSTQNSLFSTMSRIEQAVTSIAHASEASAKNLETITRDLTGSAEEFTSSLNKAGNSASKFGDDLDKSGSKVVSALNTLATGLGRLWEHLGGLRGIGREVDNLSTASNQMIKLSGMSGEVVREFRGEVMSIVADLNMSTGSAFSPTEAYQQVISISQGVTSNLEAIEEMTRPLLLTQETLDVNINTVADIFNKFYTRYNFSSHNMESVLNDIRGNTAGNSANAEATLENMRKLETIMSFTAGNDNELREAWISELSNRTAYYESMGVDTSPLAQHFEDIFYGRWADNPELVTLLNYGGMMPADAKALIEKKDPEAISKIFDALFEGYNHAAELTKDSAALGTSLSNLIPGDDVNYALDIYNARHSENYVTPEEFLENLPEPTTMEELTEDKYVSLADKANNWLEQIYAKVASIQEHLPFGLSDIALAYALFSRGGQGVPGSGGAGSRILGSFGGAGNVTGSGLKGLLTKSGYNMTGGAGAAQSLAMDGMSSGAAALKGGLGLGGVGLGLGVAGLGTYKAINEFKEGNTGYGIANTVGAIGGAVGAVGIGASMAGLAAAGPVGWIALAAGAVVLAGTSIVKAATTIGSVELIEQAYDEASQAILESNDRNTYTLAQIKRNLDNEEDLEKVRADLINSGILTEHDIEIARKANKEGLEDLTESYLEASKNFGKEYQADIYEFKEHDENYTAELVEDMISELSDMKGDIKKDSDELEFAEDLFKNIYYGMKDNMDTSKLTGDTKTFWNKLEDKIPGGLTASEAKTLINKFSKSGVAIPVEILENAVGVASEITDVGEDFYEDVMPSTKRYGTEATEVTAKIINAIHATNKESAQEILDGLKASGYTSEQYPRIKDAMEKWDLTGYAEGTNYITKDHIALLHEGESVVPKKYNPAVNSAEFKEVSKQVRESQENAAQEAQVTKEYFRSFIEEVREIRDFLEVWKADNIKRETANNAMNRHNVSRSFVQRFMVMD